MSGEWYELARLGLVVRPPDSPLPPSSWRSSPFSARFGQTVRTLGVELRTLEAKQIVLELAITEADLRIDGFPRANAKFSSQAVRLSFDSKWGPLRYETGEYGDWRDNVRAIALSLEALRKVDRYGVSKRGEQFRGWRALPTGTDPADAIATRDQAYAVILSHARDYELSDIVDEGPFLTEAIRAAQRATHPDTGGDTTEFRKVMKAVELVKA